MKERIKHVFTTMIFKNRRIPYDIWKEIHDRMRVLPNRFPENDILYVEWLDVLLISCIEQWSKEIMDLIISIKDRKIIEPLFDALKEQFDEKKQM